MLIPYRAKNPPEQFPYATLGLIGVNVIVFACTSGFSLNIQDQYIGSLSECHNNMYSEPWRIFTAMFLHENIFHIAGNMLFLWLFGAATEGRLKPAKFLALYLVAGVCGDLLEDMIWGLQHPDVPTLGASGAIMGVAGAYLYLFPYSLICIFYWFGCFCTGVWEIQARWVVLVFMGEEVLFAVVGNGADGVGHLAHIGGFGAGLLMALLLRARRDTEEISYVQSVQADAKDYTILSLSDLETLLRAPTENMDLVMAYLEKAVGSYTGASQETVLQVLSQYAAKLTTQGNPERLAYVVLRVPVSAGGLHPVFYLRLGSRLERQHSNDLASQIYRRVYDLAPTSPDTEMALYRLAQIMEGPYRNVDQARAIYYEMLRLFPAGSMAQSATAALNRIGR